MLHRFAILVAFATFIMIVAGGMVTSTDSGLSVPDWPLSYESLFPKMAGGVLYEHTHRLIGFLVGFLTLSLAGILWKKEPRRGLRRLSFWAAGIVILQGVLGGMTVLLKLPPAISILHACLAQAFFCLTVSLVLFTSPAYANGKREMEDGRWERLQKISVITFSLIFAQLILGAILRHTGKVLAGHLIGAAAIFASIFILNHEIRRAHSNEPILEKTGNILLALLGLQILAGLIMFLGGKYPILETVHVALGALTLASSLVIALQSFQPALIHKNA